jgi:predicted ATPase
LTLAAAEQPLVIVLDDLHWSDQSSLDLLEFISRDIAGKSLLLLGGYRDVELSRRHPLSETLASLARVREFQRIVLRGLDNDDVGRLIESLVHIGLSAKQIDLIHGRTEGNPFFVTEVTRDMARVYAEQGEDFDANRFKIPEGVRQAVGIRLNKLSDECNKLLQIAAVIGREFDFKLLVELDTDLSEDALLELIDEATNAGMIRESSDRNDRYEFSHALVAQTLAEELSTGRRIRMHARIVEAMERLYEGRLDEHVAELIHHCREADTVVSEEKIAHYALLAGQRSAAAYAPIEARGYFELAFEVIDEIRSATDRAAILANLGRAELLTLPYPDIQRGWDHTK